MNFTLSTDAGDLDLLGEAAGGAVGRPKDLERIAELEALREERQLRGDGGTTP